MLAVLGMSCKGGSSEDDATGAQEFEQLDERATLMKIYEALNGDSWGDWNKKNWGSEEPLKEWGGVDVDDEGHVKSLKIFDIKGAIPPEIQNLAWLKTLELDFENDDSLVANPVPGNVFQMSSLESLMIYQTMRTDKAGWTKIPEKVNLPNLKMLHLVYVDGDLHQLGDLPALENVLVKSSTPDVPEQLEKCSNLRVFFWGSREKPSKPFPEFLAKLTTLENLEMQYEEPFGEKLPECLWTMKSLKDIRLSGIASNHGELDGTKVAQLENLNFLKLTRSGITNIPEELFAMSNLEYLDLDDNAITGEIPASIGDSKLKSVSLGGNANLTGKIPESMGKLTGLYSFNLRKTGVDQNVPASVKALPKYESFSKNLFD